MAYLFVVIAMSLIIALANQKISRAKLITTKKNKKIG
jgi:hypothetical protein